MSTGTNKERIEQNNTELEEVSLLLDTTEEKVNSLPDHGIDTSSDNPITAGDVIEGKEGFVNGAKVVGTMVDNGEINITPSAEEQPIPAGHTSGGKVDGDENLIPDNIKKDVSIFGILGTLELSEDLNEPLNTQDEKIAELERQIDELNTALDGKASGGRNDLNVFCQLDEPSTKNGIWIKTDKPMNKIIFDNKITAKEEWDTINQYEPIPYQFYNGSAVAIGTNIYLLGSTVDNYDDYFYVYDILTNTYTKKDKLPYSSFSLGYAIAIGTDIYLFGADNNSDYKKCYKIDTITDTRTRMADIPEIFCQGSATSVGTDIYLFGGYFTSGYGPYKYCYKYDTLTDSYTKMTDIPYTVYNSSATSVGTDIYLFGGQSSNINYNYCYKYDTLTDTYTKMKDIPYYFYQGSAVAVGTDIYLFGGNDISGGSSNNSKNCYKYDTLTDTYTKMTDIAYNYYNGSAVNINDNKIYLFGESSLKTKVSVFITNNKEYDENSVVVSQGVLKYATKLTPNVNNMLYYFYNVWYYTKETGLDSSLPTYYGNGTEWVLIHGGEE